MSQLLIRHERERKARMRNRGVVLETLEQAHHLGVSCLVVATEKGGAIACHEIPADHVLKCRVRLRTDRDRLAIAPGANQKLPSLVVLDLGMHLIAPGLPGRIDMAAEAEARQVLEACACRPVGDRIGMLVDRDVLGAKLPEVVCNSVGNSELRLRRRDVLRLRDIHRRVGLRSDCAIADKAVDYIAHGNPFSRSQTSPLCAARAGRARGIHQFLRGGHVCSSVSPVSISLQSQKASPPSIVLRPCSAYRSSYALYR